MSEDNIYNSGLNEADWKSLRDVIWPFIHAKEPDLVELPIIPSHLIDHALVKYIQKYKETGDEKYLDMAGQCLIPTEKYFGWYVPITK